MSLYDDLELVKQKPEQVAGWSSSIKLFQSQLQLKKAAQTQPKREQIRKSSVVLAPVIDLKSKKEEDESNANTPNNINYSNRVTVSCLSDCFTKIKIFKICEGLKYCFRHVSLCC